MLGDRNGQLLDGVREIPRHLKCVVESIDDPILFAKLRIARGRFPALDEFAGQLRDRTERSFERFRDGAGWVELILPVEVVDSNDERQNGFREAPVIVSLLRKRAAGFFDRLEKPKVTASVFSHAATERGNVVRRDWRPMIHSHLNRIGHADLKMFDRRQWYEACQICGIAALAVNVKRFGR
jgi:hypothetical protein